MENITETIVKTVDTGIKEDIKVYLSRHGLVVTLLYLVEYVWDEETIERARATVETRDKTSDLYELLFEEFKIKEHFRITDSHKTWVEKAYCRLKDFVPNMTEEDVKKHDLSKYNFIQSIGYTAKWIHNVDWNNIAWQKGLQDHYQKEAHHPEFHKGKRMTLKDLEESLIDMVACRWERQLGGREDVTNSEIVDFDTNFLLRYVTEDKEEIEVIIKKIQDADKVL